MECFEALNGIDDFCKVLVKKPPSNISEAIRKDEREFADKATVEKNIQTPSNPRLLETDAIGEIEDPLIDVFDEGDNLRILVQCRCREQQVTFHPAKDGMIICREECFVKEGESETCNQVCRKLNIQTEELQLENMLFVIAKCNNNNTLEALIPKAQKPNM